MCCDAPVLDHITLDIAPPIYLRFSLFTIQLRDALLAWSEALETPPQPMRILLYMCPDPQLRIAARSLMGPKQLKGDVR